MRWVRKHGLLRLKDANKHRPRNENQEPITFDEFRREARYAREAMTLFEAIHSKGYDALRARISLQDYDPLRPGEGSADVYLDGQPIPMSRSTRELTDDTVLSAAKLGLQCFVRERVGELPLDFDIFTVHSQQTEGYRPRLVFKIPDLYRAIWYQFACLMADTRPVKYCEFCEAPVFSLRRKTCNDACRKAKSRQKNPAS